VHSRQRQVQPTPLAVLAHIGDARAQGLAARPFEPDRPPARGRARPLTDGARRSPPRSPCARRRSSPANADDLAGTEREIDAGAAPGMRRSRAIRGPAARPSQGPSGDRSSRARGRPSRRQASRRGPPAPAASRRQLVGTRERPKPSRHRARRSRGPPPRRPPRDGAR
jgi:hypothetical protein